MVLYFMTTKNWINLVEAPNFESKINININFMSFLVVI